MTISTTIFETPQRTVELAVAAARELGIKTVLAASCTGFVADTLLQQDLTGLSPVIVSHAYGFLADGENELPSDKRRHYESLGVPVCTAAHPLSGAERSLSNAFGGAYPVEVMAHTLRLFGQGTKGCVEACAIAADAGVIVPGSQSWPLAARVTGPTQHWCCDPPTPIAYCAHGLTTSSASRCARLRTDKKPPCAKRVLAFGAGPFKSCHLEDIARIDRPLCSSKRTFASHIVFL